MYDAWRQWGQWAADPVSTCTSPGRGLIQPHLQDELVEAQRPAQQAAHRALVVRVGVKEHRAAQAGALAPRGRLRDAAHQGARRAGRPSAAAAAPPPAGNRGLLWMLHEMMASSCAMIASYFC